MPPGIYELYFTFIYAVAGTIDTVIYPRHVYIIKGNR